ncbi:G3E family GTPase [Murinocardiopsis flavida]|uniref:G3E family GTPase n=1 Tax=Murinocardiopsis flavida TaxID=645275 RepID=A0A2P8DS12_9ACTN|nr:GTP-binding protein [Murinocardiopsis flavida]PSK99997.1 G3E family GTPase [Murinocardiopsis flavida]
MAQTMPMRVVVVAGLHSAARDRAVNELLHSTAKSIALHHDLHAIAKGEVHRRLRDRWGVVDRRRVELVHACITCTLREDLIPALVSLAREGEYATCVVEAWDGVDPATIAEALDTRAADHPAHGLLSLAAVVTAVDADLLVADLASGDDMRDRGKAVAAEDDRTAAEALTRQIEYPTVLALAGPGDGSADAGEAGTLLEHLNPAAVVIALGDARLPLVVEGRFSPANAAVRLDPACAQYPDHRQDGRVSTLTWRRRRPMEPGRLHAILDEAVATGLRSRGRFWIAGRPDTLLVWDAGGGALAIGAGGPWLASLPDAAWEMVSDARRASARVDWHPDTGDRCQCLSFTGFDIDAERIIGLLDSCLLTDEEMREPRQQRATGPDPFAEFLGAVS